MPLVLFLMPTYYYIVNGDFNLFFCGVGVLGLACFVIIFIRFLRTLKVNKAPVDFKNQKLSLKFFKRALLSLGWNIREESSKHIRANVDIKGQRGSLDFYIFFDANNQYSICIDDNPFLTLHSEVHELRKYYESRIIRLNGIQKNRFYSELENQILPDYHYEKLKTKKLSVNIQILRVMDVDYGFKPYTVFGNVVEVISPKENKELQLIIKLDKVLDGWTMNILEFKKVDTLVVNIYPKYIESFLNRKSVLSKLECSKKPGWHLFDLFLKGGNKKEVLELITYDAKVKMI